MTMRSDYESEKQLILDEITEIHRQAAITIEVARVVAIICSIALIVAFACLLASISTILMGRF